MLLQSKYLPLVLAYLSFIADSLKPAAIGTLGRENPAPTDVFINNPISITLIRQD